VCKPSFLERQIGSLHGVLDHALRSERLAPAPGLLQRFDARVRVIAMLVLIGLTVSAHSLGGLALLFALSVALALASRIAPTVLARGIWLNVAMFTGVLALPAIFLVPGEAVARLPALGWAVTRPGLESAGFLIGRAATAATFAALPVLVTPWPHLLKALRTLGLPAVLVAILAMTYRYIFVLLQTALDMFEARRSRQVGRLSGPELRRMRVADAGMLLSKSLHLADEVFLAMQSRGYRGEQHALIEFRLAAADWAALAGLAAIAALALRSHV
jgi:cobalt/nickel transport system permease protein